jgi:hypothetical protein
VIVSLQRFARQKSLWVANRIKTYSVDLGKRLLAAVDRGAPSRFLGLCYVGFFPVIRGPSTGATQRR